MVIVKLVTIGNIDPELNIRKVKKWRSSISQVDQEDVAFSSFSNALSNVLANSNLIIFNKKIN